LHQKINVILVEPAGPINIGSVARLCENFGVHQLRLVSPRCNHNNEEAKRMAVKGKELLANAEVFPCLLDAIYDCPRIIATAGRIEHGGIPLCNPKEALNWSLESYSSAPIALIFGREDRGLTNQELLLAHKVLTLETMSNYPSLNLSHAVAIVLHELRCCESQKLKCKQKNTFEDDLATPIQINDCLIDAEDLLLQIGFLYEHTATARMSKIRALIQRAEIRPNEISLIRGVLRQMRWAIGKQNS